MTNQEAVTLIDATAKFHIWADGPCGWVKGNGWETKIANSEQRAWDLAVEVFAGRKPAETLTYEVYKHPSPFNGRKWAVKLPHGIESYKTKRHALRVAQEWKGAE